jgi:hypothetical protein
MKCDQWACPKAQGRASQWPPNENPCCWYEALPLSPALPLNDSTKGAQLTRSSMVAAGSAAWAHMLCALTCAWSLHVHMGGMQSLQKFAMQTKN